MIPWLWSVSPDRLRFLMRRQTEFWCSVTTLSAPSLRVIRIPRMVRSLGMLCCNVLLENEAVTKLWELGWDAVNWLSDETSHRLFRLCSSVGVFDSSFDPIEHQRRRWRCRDNVVIVGEEWIPSQLCDEKLQGSTALTVFRRANTGFEIVSHLVHAGFNWPLRDRINRKGWFWLC